MTVLQYCEKFIFRTYLMHCVLQTSELHDNFPAMKGNYHSIVFRRRSVVTQAPLLKLPLFLFSKHRHSLFTFFVLRIVMHSNVIFFKKQQYFHCHLNVNLSHLQKHKNISLPISLEKFYINSPLHVRSFDTGIK